MLKLHARDLRDRKPTEEELVSIQRRPLYMVLDNVLDTYNIGGLFRLADAVGAAEVIICGESETPPSSRIHKAAVGLEAWVPWSYSKTAEEALRKLKITNSKLQIIAVEQSEKSKPYNELRVASHELPIAIVVGHETDGVSKNVLEMADQVLEIPMFGVNKSLNVIVSCAIVAYEILEKWGKR
ncbi:MAG: TrmH family RNA methyltransferase [Patescibacteria group bacterium]